MATGASFFVALVSRTSRGTPSTYLGEHLLSSESLDVSNGTGSSLLELNTLQSLVQVERVVTACSLHLRLLSSFFYHLN